MNGRDTFRILPPCARPPAMVAALLLVVLASCAAPAPVVQGTVVSVDARVLRVQDETRPRDPALAIDISHAEMGNPPAVGETVRVVYRDEGSVRRALAVMSVSRQRRMEGEGQ